jgi:LPS export ABC transporter protein LptC
VSWQAKFVMSEGGRPRAIIEASQMQQYQASDSAYSVWRSPKDTSQVKLYLFGTQGDSTATLRADSLVFQDQKGLLDAYTNVVVVTESNKRLATEHLTWRQADRKIRTKRFVRIRTPTEVVQGNGLVADEDLDTYQIGRFSATVTVDDEDDPETDEGGGGGGGGS